MYPKRSRRRPDLFSVLVLVVAIGLSLTVGYQVNLYYGDQQPPVAKQSPSGPAVGG